MFFFNFVEIPRYNVTNSEVFTELKTPRNYAATKDTDI